MQVISSPHKLTYWHFRANVGLNPFNRQVFTINNFSLVVNYKNNFAKVFIFSAETQENPNLLCEYALPADCHVTLTVHNVLGQKVKVLVNEYQSSGHKSVQWDGKDDQNQDVSSGLYFYRIQAGDLFQLKKMILLK